MESAMSAESVSGRPRLEVAGRSLRWAQLALGALAMSVPLVFQSPFGPWVPGGFGSATCVFVVCALLITQLGRSGAYVGKRWTLCAMVCVALAYALELYGMRLVGRFGIAGFLAHRVSVGFRAVPVDAVGSVGELVMPTVALLLLMVRLSLPGNARKGTASLKLSTCALASSSMLIAGMVWRTMPGVQISAGLSLPFAWASALVGGFVCLLTASSARTSLVVRSSGGAAGGLLIGSFSFLLLLVFWLGVFSGSVWDAWAWVYGSLGQEARQLCSWIFPLVLTLSCVGCAMAMRHLRREDCDPDEGVTKGSGKNLAPSHLVESLRGFDTLSVKEAVAVRGTAMGKTQAEMASEQGVSTSSIGSYLARAYRKLGFSNRQHLMRAIAEMAAGVTLESSERRQPVETPRPSGRSKDVVACLGAVALWVSSMIALLPSGFSSSGMLVGLGAGCLALLPRISIGYDRIASRRSHSLVVQVVVSSLLAGLNWLAASPMPAFGGLVPEKYLLPLGLVVGFVSAIVVGEVCLVSAVIGSRWRPSRNELGWLGLFFLGGLMVAWLLGRVWFATASACALALLFLRRSDGVVPHGGIRPPGLADWRPGVSKRPAATASAALSVALALTIRIDPSDMWPLSCLAASIALCLLLMAAAMSGRVHVGLLIPVGLMCGLTIFAGLPRFGKGFGLLGVAVQLFVLGLSVAWWAFVMTRSVPFFETGDVNARRVKWYLLGKGLGETEAEVVWLTCLGYSAGSIAEVLSISRHTAAAARTRAYGTLRVHSREELVGLLRRELMDG